MDFWNLAIVFLLGILAGFVNAISAAGSLISMPALIFAGLTPAEANASNRVAILAQNFTSAYAFYEKGYKAENYMFWLAAACMPGAVLGSWFSLKVPDEIFTRILSVVMLVFLVVTILNPLKNTSAAGERLDLRSKVIGCIAYFFSGIYGGFIQAGSGFFLMGACMLINRFDIVKANYYKAVIMFLYTVAAFAVFLFTGKILWQYGLFMALAMSIGGYIGSRFTISASDKWLRVVIVIIITGMAVYLWFLK